MRNYPAKAGGYESRKKKLSLDQILKLNSLWFEGTATRADLRKEFKCSIDVLERHLLTSRAEYEKLKQERK
jgi:hypothetical protein